MWLALTSLYKFGTKASSLLLLFMQPRNSSTEEIFQGLRTSLRLFIHLTLAKMILLLVFEQ